MGRFSLFIIAMACLIAVGAAATEDRYPHPPPLQTWTRILNVEKDRSAQDAGSFAVKNYDEQNHVYLTFQKVVEGQKLWGWGGRASYKLLIKALDGNLVRYYTSQVEQEGQRYSKYPSFTLTSFQPVLP